MRERARHAAAWLAFGLGLATSAQAGTITIGAAGPFSGPDSVFGNPIRIGVDQAVADADAAGGILGQTAKVVPGDDQNDIKKGEAIAKGFVKAGVRYVVGHLSSAVTVPTSQIYADANVLDITPTALAPLVTDRGLETIFRTCGREDEQAIVATNYLIGHHIARVAIVHDRTSTGKALADAVRKGLADAGVKDVYYGSLDKGTRDFSGLVGRIKASGAQVAFWGGASTEAGLLVRQLHDANAKTILMGGLGMAGDDFASGAGAAADGTLMVFPRDPKTQPSAADLLRRLRQKGIEPDGAVFYAYAAVQVIGQAAAAAKSPDPQALAKTMHSGMTFKTVLGDLAFDKKGDPKVSDLAVYVWRKGATGRMTFDQPA